MFAPSRLRVTPTAMQDEMCNMYMMTYSELPVFMTCGNGQSWYQVDGPGGIPPGSTLAPESPAVWQPPLSAGASTPAGDELTLGQIAGALEHHDEMPFGPSE